MVKLYLAAPWVIKDQMAEISKKFEDAGHTITKKWWDVVPVREGDEGYVEQLKKQALEDAQGVFDSDLVILINSSKSEGKAVEQGIAIALGRIIIAVGERGAVSKNVFHYLDNFKWIPDLESALEIVNKYAEVDRLLKELKNG